jgi:hypothetical protein
MDKKETEIDGLIKHAEETHFKLVAVHLETGFVLDMPVIDGVAMAILPNKIKEIADMSRKEREDIMRSNFKMVTDKIADKCDLNCGECPLSGKCAKQDDGTIHEHAKTDTSVGVEVGKYDEKTGKVKYASKPLDDKEARMFG